MRTLVDTTDALVTGIIALVSGGIGFFFGAGRIVQKLADHEKYCEKCKEAQKEAHERDIARLERQIEQLDERLNHWDGRSWP